MKLLTKISQVLSAEQYLKIAKEKPNTIAKTKFMSPKLGKK